MSRSNDLRIFGRGFDSHRPLQIQKKDIRNNPAAIFHLNGDFARRIPVHDFRKIVSFEPLNENRSSISSSSAGRIGLVM